METTGAGDQVRSPGCDVLGAAASLRWGRPDLTGALAEHRMEEAAARSDRDGWLAAAGWRLHAAAATGDGRDTAAEVLDALPRWGSDVLRHPAALRVRMELAVLAHDSGEAAVAPALLPRAVAVADPELAADLRTAAVRCSSEDGAGRDEPDADDGSAATDLALSATVTAWAAVGEARGEIGAASAQLVGAAAARRDGRSEIAIARAVDGLARLDRVRDTSTGPTPSGHLAAALAAEWIAALIDAGRPEEARDGSGPVRDRLVEFARPTRQLALLRLTVARATASDPQHGSDLAPDLERAAQDAAASDIPALEHICRTALAELYESAGRLEDAAESVRLAAEADRRHRARTERFRVALAGAAPLWTDDGPTGAPHDRAGHPGRLTVAPPAARSAPASGATSRANGNGSGVGTERTAVLRAVQAASMSDRPDRPGLQGRPADTADRGASDRAVRRPTDTVAGPDDGLVAGSDAGGGSGDRASSDASTADTQRRNGAAQHARWGPGTATGSGAAERGNGSGPRQGVGAPGTARTDGAAPEGAERGGGNADHRTADHRTADARPADPWATGVWTAPPVAPADRARPAQDPAPDHAEHAAAPDHPQDAEATARAEAERRRVESALADPDTWLAGAMAELDRIWGVGETPAGDVDVDGEQAPGADGCVVVLDLALAGERLPADAAAPTVRRLTRRLEDRLPPRSRLRDDGPDAVSVVLPGRDRTAASEWLQRILPDLVDGLAVDAATGGALLRAAVHDADGEVDAQILQRLDGTRGRNGTPTVPRTSAPRSGERGSRPEADAPGSTGAQHASPTPPPDAADATTGRGVHPDPLGPPDAVPSDAGQAPAALEPPPTGSNVRGGARHDQSADRRPYLPAGVVVRPGTGGRRHRRAAEPPPDAPEPDEVPDPAPQSPDGLGLADLLAGALAAYRRI